MNILSLGEKIKKLRKEKNMTLKELAGDRITAAQISHIERDKSHTSYELLEYLSEKLDVNIEYLLETKEMQSKKITDNLILQSEIFIKCNELDKAKNQIMQVEKICKDYNLTENNGKCNYLVATINLKKENHSEAISNFEKALYFFIKNNDKKNIFRCYLNIGNIYQEEAFYKGAISHFNFAEEVLIDSGIENAEIYKELYSKMAKCYMKIDDPQNALEYIEKINTIDKQNDTKEEVELIILKANTLLSAGKYEESKDCFKRALETIEKEENKTDLANIYLTISDIYRDMGDTEKVLEYSHMVYDIKKSDEDECMMNGLFKIIEAYIDSEKYELARKYCKLALVSSIKYKNKFNEYRSLKLYSDMYKKQEEVTPAIEYLSKCIKIISELEDGKTLANLYIDLGQLYSGISKEKELEYYQKGVFMYRNLEII
ncbi:helix-turn-helix domain-containing protein [Romboutsia maritimum]|uniref:Helix-turn-helix domain-containing protein n=1 Tax=Romboutsia maritimum TaxID=2020948 RepID=A0A371ISJ1_9FIRM|nr:tetratricopeptide repeat protein [Romboutsia maritimum]RDY23439.1 helix-turn-helix domain-containing protein [Romboutsia maritimum]